MTPQTETTPRNDNNNLFDIYDGEVQTLSAKVFAMVEHLNTHAYQGTGGEGRQFEDLLELSRLIEALATARLVLRTFLKASASTYRNTRQ